MRREETRSAERKRRGDASRRLPRRVDDVDSAARSAGRTKHAQSKTKDKNQNHARSRRKNRHNHALHSTHIARRRIKPEENFREIFEGPRALSHLKRRCARALQSTEPFLETDRCSARHFAIPCAYVCCDIAPRQTSIISFRPFFRFFWHTCKHTPEKQTSSSSLSLWAGKLRIGGSMGVWIPKA